MKKLHLAFILALSFIAGIAKAQVNIQEMYDFNREQMTTTLEMFKGDKWGSTFFFVDIYHTKNVCPTDFYTEISRSLNFWGNTAMKDFNLHAEWNGGCGVYKLDQSWGGYDVRNAWLFGAEYFFHSKDYQNTLTVQVLYKTITQRTSQVPMQLTAVWGMNDLFGLKGLNFSGFADFWWEDHTWTKDATTESTSGVFLTEPQLWYNVGQHFGVDNLFIGGEVEISCNFSGAVNYKGWKINPAAGLKWNF